MKNLTATFLAAMLNDQLKTIEVQFKDCAGQPVGASYTYKTELDLEVGDEVVVDSPSTGMTVVYVSQIHDLPQLDTQAPFQYKWVVSKVDRAGYDTRLETEADLEKEFAVIKHKQQRLNALNELKESLGVAFGEDCPELDELLNRLSGK